MHKTDLEFNTRRKLIACETFSTTQIFQLWCCEFRKGGKVLIISHSQVDAEFSIRVQRGRPSRFNSDRSELVDDILRKAEGVLSSLQDKGQ